MISTLSITTEPVFFPDNTKSMSPFAPDAEILGATPLAAFEIVTSLTADSTVAGKTTNSLPLASAIYPAESNLGAVSVLLINVSTVALPTNVSVP